MREVPLFSSKELKYYKLFHCKLPFWAKSLIISLQYFDFPLTLEYRPDPLTPVSLRIRLNLASFDVPNDLHFCYNYF